MKPTTSLHARFQAKGLPAKTQYFEGSASQAVLAFAKWLFAEGLRMNSTIELKLARTKDELDAKQSRSDDVVGELDELFNQLLAEHEIETIQTVESE